MARGCCFFCSEALQFGLGGGGIRKTSSAFAHMHACTQICRNVHPHWYCRHPCVFVCILSLICSYINTCLCMHVGMQVCMYVCMYVGM